MVYKAVLFDLDGTLLDTLEDIADSANRVLAEMGLPEHPLDSYRYFVGNGLMTLMERVVPADKRDQRTIASVAEAFRKDYGGNWHMKSRPYAGVHRMLQGLLEHDLELAVLSNKPQVFTVLCVERLLVGIPFHPVFGQREGVPRKPDPAGALEVARELGVDPEQFLYIGDTSTDMQTAKNAGMVAVGALWGFRTEEELRTNGADHLIATPVDLLELLK